nr:e3 sumo-protein ligase pli1 [Quercus suber]
MQVRLALFSPCLQSVVFRAIGREMLHGCIDEIMGITNLEVLYHLDQDMVRQGTVRGKQALHRGRKTLKMLIQLYRKYEQCYKSDPNPPPFQIPGDILATFQDLGDRGITQANAGMSAARPGLASGSGRSVLPQLPQVRQQHASFAFQAQHQPVHPTDAGRFHFFFPRTGAPPPPIPNEPNTARIALHQSHLRSPALGPIGLAVVPNQLYRQVSGFAFWPPWRLVPDVIKQYTTFTISAKDEARTAKTLIANGTKIRQRTVDPHSLTWRLRCAKFRDASHAWNESSWLEADSVWPDDTYFFIGEDQQPLGVRRKLHHGRCLPTDLTPYLHEGSNIITVAINRHLSNRSKPYHYAVAVEMVEIISHQHILDHILDMDDQTSLRRITDSLRSHPSVVHDDDDDEVMIVTTSVNLNIRNPHTLLLIDVPVRSSRCKHFDCFDLPTYLLSAKRDDPTWPSKADTWRCPICRCDARPSLLLKDGFFARVLRELRERGQTDVDTIIVEADGRWCVKAREATTGVRSASLEREEAAAAAATGGNVRKEKGKERVVIELDDD